MFFIPEDKRGLVHYKRIFLIIVYMIIFIFSVFSIIQIRFFTHNSEQVLDSGRFIFLFLVTPRITHGIFLLLKLTLFAITASGSFVLMLSNYYMFQNPTLEQRMLKHTKKDVKKLLKS